MITIKPSIIATLLVSLLSSTAYSADVNFSVTGKVTAGTCQLSYGTDTPADGNLDFGRITIIHS